ncbi:2'-5'-oligoadenylate synthase 3-like isoform X3 [Asterias rubens]|uniref:2'-5'-oligoadenylate synthase 3-like isoform X3 n=1 Tax=Asterias rubens TaxID=7604 RepID=UPI001455B9C2|nr:2'-5'-oligoadenylate synthase 3-like isoform X3 [Asterias rubens]
MASGGKKKNEDEGSAGSWFTFGAALAAAAVGTYAAVKLVQHVTKEAEPEDEPPVTRGYSSGSGGGYRGGQDYQSSSSSDWFPSQDSYNPRRGSQEPKRVPKPFGSIPVGRNNMGSPMIDYGPAERNPSTRGDGLVLEEEKPWCLTQGELETWYKDNIQLGTKEFKSACSSAIDNVVRHIHRKCSSNILNFDVDKVVKGGSLGKGTMVKGLSDVDLVAFVNKPYLKPIAEIGKEEYTRTLSRIISDIKSTLEGVPDVQIVRSDRYLVNFKMQVDSRWIDVDLLPTTDNAKCYISDDDMFRSMLEVGNGTRQLYSASFVQDQVQFVKDQPGYVKELIRLVKYWASRFLPKYLQKSYPLELITIYLWEKAGEPGRRLSKARGLRSVLEVLTNLDELCTSWQDKHIDEDLSEDNIIKKDKMKRPIVLDPANPTNNVCYMYQGKDKITGDPFMKVIKAAAERTLRTDLLRNVTAWPNLKGGNNMVLEKEEPWCLSPGNLETWYNGNIQRGTDDFRTDCQSAIDSVVRHIHKNCSSDILDFDVDKVVKGGSLGKGTMVKDLSDVDLVAFVNRPYLKPIAKIGKEEYTRTLSRIISDIKSTLKGVPGVQIVRSDQYLVNFKMQVDSRWIDVDLLPTTDNAKCYISHSDMFRAMLQLHDNHDREFYSASLAEHQLSFVGNQPRYVKELVRLVKYWAKEYLPGYLQNSYGLELITIHLWEKAGKPVEFSKAQGLKRVLRALTRLTALRVTSWSSSRLYDATLAQSAITQLRMINPIVLDPANPTNNVCQLYQQGTNGREIASAAGQTLQTQLLMKVKVRQGWKAEGAGSNFMAAQGGARSVLENEEPWCLSEGDLETWYNENIQLGTNEFARKCQSAISRVVRFVHSNCSLDILEFDVDKVVKGGSLGKGTMVKDLSDVDLVAFVNKPYVQPIAEIGKDAYKETITGINFNIASTLELNPDVKDIKHDEYVVKFEIDVGSRWIEVDLLPTTDNIKSHSSYEEMFRYMLSKGHRTRQYCSPSLVHRQVQFVKEQPGNVKELIRLVKYWASRFLPKYLQKSYPLELITIYLWEKAGRPERRLNKAQGLRSVLEVLTNLEELCASWQYKHNDEHITQDIIKKDNMKRPIVLDPANPTFNVCYMYQQWKDKITGDPFMKVIKAAAERTLRTTLLRNVTAWPNLSE